MDLEKYRALFVDEATDHLAEMSHAVTTLEKRPPPEEASAAIDCLFRMAHSIKGMAGSLEYHAPAELAHKLEDWMEPLRDGGEVDDACRRVGVQRPARGALRPARAPVGPPAAAWRAGTRS
jgi:chemotaxis protein histidine kinase CheA